MPSDGSRSESVPHTLRLAAAVSWRVLVVAGAIVAVALLVARLRLVFLPCLVALFLATVLIPPASALTRRGWPRGLAALAAIAGSLSVLAGVGWAVALPVAAELDDLDLSIQSGIERIGDWLVEGPLGLSERQVDSAIERGLDQLRSNGSTIAGGLVSGTLLLVEVLAGALLTLVLLFFFLKDGERLWNWIVGLFPAQHRADVAEIGARVWRTLGAYLRGVAAVGFVDAVLIGLALYLIGVPLVLPLAVLTFLGGFFPIVGATVAGFAAAMVALVSNGFAAALLVTTAVIVVQQLEGHLLQPLIVGRSVRLHPVAVLLSLVAGGVLWGIAGAFLAVPVTAALASIASYLRSDRRRTGAADGVTPSALSARRSSERMS